MAVRLENKPLPKYQITDKKLQDKLGVFVTIHKNGQLRGCIGQFEPATPLWQTVQDMALSAAFNDPRFPPLAASELDQIRFEISALSQPKPINDWRKIKLGVHGVIIQANGRSGTFLPQVATETGWGLEEFLSQLCTQKCCLPPNCYKQKGVKIFVYEVEKIK